MSPGHGLLILAAVLIAVNGFPFSYSLQTPLRAAPCGLCGGFPPHQKADNKINRKTCLPHCTSGVSQPRVTPSKGSGMRRGISGVVSIALGSPLPHKKHIPPTPSSGSLPAAAFCLDTPLWGAIGLWWGGEGIFLGVFSAFCNTFFHSGWFFWLSQPGVKGY